jgi:ABC-2 type transport system permease protein
MQYRHGSSWASAALQVRLLTRQPDSVAPLLVTPLYAIALFGFLHHSGKSSIGSSVFVASILMTLWSTVVFVGADMVDDDRHEGVLELVEASGTGYLTFLSARIATAAALTSPAIVFVTVLAWLFGVRLPVHSPLVLVLDVLGSWACCVGVGIALACLLAMSRSARNYQNVLTYPFYVLGGILVAPSALPAHLGVLAPVVFLSHSAAAARAGLTGTGSQWGPLGWLYLLALVHFGIAVLAVRYVRRRLKVLGTASYG